MADWTTEQGVWTARVGEAGLRLTFMSDGYQLDWVNGIGGGKRVIVAATLVEAQRVAVAIVRESFHLNAANAQRARDAFEAALAEAPAESRVPEVA